MVGSVVSNPETFSNGAARKPVHSGGGSTQQGGSESSSASRHPVACQVRPLSFCPRRRLPLGQTAACLPLGRPRPASTGRAESAPKRGRGNGSVKRRLARFIDRHRARRCSARHRAGFGLGAPPERLPRLFEAFFMTKIGGMEMGSLLGRSIIEAHGGRVWVTANDRRDAVFQFAVPEEARLAP
jgi:hypothetical protein